MTRENGGDFFKHCPHILEYSDVMGNAQTLHEGPAYSFTSVQHELQIGDRRNVLEMPVQDGHLE